MLTLMQPYEECKPSNSARCLSKKIRCCVQTDVLLINPTEESTARVSVAMKFNSYLISPPIRYFKLFADNIFGALIHSPTEFSELRAIFRLHLIYICDWLYVAVEGCAEIAMKCISTSVCTVCMIISSRE